MEAVKDLYIHEFFFRDFLSFIRCTPDPFAPGRTARGNVLYILYFGCVISHRLSFVAGLLELCVLLCGDSVLQWFSFWVLRYALASPPEHNIQPSSVLCNFD